MGEKIKVLNEFKNIVIELNEPQQIGGYRLIHLQNKDFRLCIDENELLQILVLIDNAVYHLSSYKKLDHKNE